MHLGWEDNVWLESSVRETEKGSHIVSTEREFHLITLFNAKVHSIKWEHYTQIQINLSLSLFCTPSSRLCVIRVIPIAAPVAQEVERVAH